MDFYGFIYDFYILPLIMNGIYAADESYTAVLPIEIGEEAEGADILKILENYTEIYAKAIESADKISDMTDIESENVNNIYINATETALYKTEEYGRTDVFNGYYGKDGGYIENVLREYRNETEKSGKYGTESVYETVVSENESKNYFETYGAGYERVFNEAFGSVFGGSVNEAYFGTLNENRKVNVNTVGGREITLPSDEKGGVNAGAVTNENRSVKNEFVINLGGITQNITGGAGEAADIGEAVAQCIINAINTAKEGAY